MVSSLFTSLPDFRVQGRCIYKLSELLTIALLTLLCGGTSYVDMHEFAVARARAFGLLSNVSTSPSCDTFARIFQLLKPDIVKKFLQELGKKYLQLSKCHIAIDGKCLRGANPKLLGHKGLYLMNAFICEYRVLLSQQLLQDKWNEIKALPDVIESLDIKGHVISIDAIGTQTEIVELIIQKQGHYFLAVKENQKSLYEAIRGAFIVLHPTQVVETLEKDHGRIEKRICRIMSANKLFDKTLLERWKGLTTIVEIESKVTIGDKTSVSFRYFISDENITNARYYNNLARSHWSIENQLHWHLDVTFKEDASRVRTGNAPQNLSLMRKIALHVLTHHKNERDTKKRLFRCAIDNSYLLQLLKDCFT